MSDAIQVGDMVTWTKSVVKGRAIHLATREGQVTRVGEASATVQKKNGRREDVRLDSIRKVGERSHLTEFFFKLAEGLDADDRGGQAK